MTLTDHVTVPCPADLLPLIADVHETDVETIDGVPQVRIVNPVTGAVCTLVPAQRRAGEGE